MRKAGLERQKEMDDREIVGEAIYLENINERIVNYF
jgi:hypothetical protein